MLTFDRLLRLLKAHYDGSNKSRRTASFEFRLGDARFSWSRQFDILRALPLCNILEYHLTVGNIETCIPLHSIFGENFTVCRLGRNYRCDCVVNVRNVPSKGLDLSRSVWRAIASAGPFGLVPLHRAERRKCRTVNMLTLLPEHMQHHV